MLCFLALATCLSSRTQHNVAIGETVKVSAAKELSLAEDLNNNGTIDHLTLTGTSATGTSTVRNAGYATFASDGSLVAGKGVMAWFYGNSGGAASAGSMTGTQTVSSFGELNESGNVVTLPVSFSARGFAGWNLVSNPFASAIDWSSNDITKTNLSNVVYRWKPASESWTTWSGDAGSESGVSSVIGSGGSFFVKATGPSPLLTIPQTAKSEATGTSSLHFAAVPQRELRSRVAPSAVRLAGVRVSVKGQGNPLPDAVYLDLSREDRIRSRQEG